MLNPPPFRGLSDPFLDALDALVTDKAGQWWRDVLAHPDLILSVLSESLNVYHRAASLFRVTLRQGRPVPETHVKYLVRRRQRDCLYVCEGLKASDKVGKVCVRNLVAGIEMAPGGC